SSSLALLEYVDCSAHPFGAGVPTADLTSFPMFSFFKKKPPQPAPVPAPQEEVPVIAEESAPESAPVVTAETAPVAPTVTSEAPVTAPASDEVKPEVVAEVTPVNAEIVAIETPVAQKQSWMARLKAGLSKTSSNLTTLFVGAKIDDELYEELESALLMADAGVDATQFLLDGLKRKVKSEKLTDAAQVKTALRSLLIEMLTPLQKPLVLGRHQPLIMMIAGVNGAGKTTTIGKLAKHMQ